MPNKPSHLLIDAYKARETHENHMIRDIPDYEGLYQVSRDGEVFSCARFETFQGRWGLTTRKRPRKKIKDWDCKGYRQVLLYKKGCKKHFHVHRLVALAFLPNPDNLPEVNHIDEDRRNNQLDNLEWCTRKHNALHSVHKTTGSNCGTSKLDESQVFDIKRLIEEGYCNKTIASWYEVDHTTISKIRTRVNWKHVK